MYKGYSLKTLHVHGLHHSNLKARYLFSHLRTEYSRVAVVLTQPKGGLGICLILDSIPTKAEQSKSMFLN